MPKYANYAWVITTSHLDHLADHDPRFNETKRRWEHTIPRGSDPVDIVGPRNVHPKAEEMLKAGKGTAFQLWDDDGIRYFTGRFFESLDGLGLDDVVDDDYPGDPLGDYGAASGCTHMTVKNGEGFIG